MLVDLHTHSTASDGQYTPTELVELAKQHGLEAISITDHDTVDGLAEALQAGRRMGLKVIPGIEPLFIFWAMVFHRSPPV